MMNSNNTFAEYKERKQREGKLPVINDAELSPEEIVKRKYNEYKQKKRRENEKQDHI